MLLYATSRAVCRHLSNANASAAMEELIKDIVYSEKYQDDTYEYR